MMMQERQSIRIGGGAGAAQGPGGGDSGLDSVARSMRLHEELLEELLARFYMHRWGRTGAADPAVGAGLGGCAANACRAEGVNVLACCDPACQ